MQGTKTCPKCSGLVLKETDLVALVPVFKESRGYKFKTGNFIPARNYTCHQCGYIELYREG